MSRPGSWTLRLPRFAAAMSLSTLSAQTLKLRLLQHHAAEDRSWVARVMRPTQDEILGVARGGWLCSERLAPWRIVWNGRTQSSIDALAPIRTGPYTVSHASVGLLTIERFCLWEA